MAKKHSAPQSQKNRAGRQRSRAAALRERRPALSSLDAAGIALIFCLVLIVYFPSLEGKALWDDAGHITAPALQSFHGLWRIWSELGATQQYYPLLHSAFWIEHRLWGDAVLGYHLINVFLHCLSACLVIFIVRRLRLPGAWLAGLIFALHPVCVEAVAWISEQKSTLSTVFYLAAALTYLRFDETRRKAHYFAALALFALALLSKTVTATLPAALLLVLWWRHGRIDWKRHLAPLLPWLGAGAFAGLFTAWVEKAYIGAQGPDFSLTLLQRGLLAGRALWFYLAKLAWPSNLTFIYPRWTIDAGAWWQYLFPAVFLALLVCLWRLGLRWRGLTAGLLFFAGTLFPALGFLNVFPFRYSYVADHFQYLACLGIIIPVAFGLTIGTGKLRAAGVFSNLSLLGKKPVTEVALVGMLLLILGTLTWRQSWMYADMESLWRTTIARNPGSSIAHNNLGQLLFQEGRVDEAMGYCRTAVTLNPGNAEANANLANTLRYQQRLEEALVYYRKASALRPEAASFHGSIANTLVEIGKIEEAVGQYETALRLDPSDALLMNNLAWILATSPQASVRKGAKAVELASRAVHLLGGNDPTTLGTLAAAYAEVGQFEEAAATAEKARALAEAAGETEFVAWEDQLLELYRSRLPYHENMPQ